MRRAHGPNPDAGSALALRSPAPRALSIAPTLLGRLWRGVSLVVLVSSRRDLPFDFYRIALGIAVLALRWAGVLSPQ